MSKRDIFFLGFVRVDKQVPLRITRSFSLAPFVVDVLSVNELLRVLGRQRDTGLVLKVR